MKFVHHFRAVAPLIFLLLTGIGNAATPAPAAYPYPLDAAGWMVVSVQPSSKQFYVSSSGGNDANVGTQASPLQTIARAMKLVKSGEPDWIYLKDGDSFNEQVAGPLQGSGPHAHAVLTSYGNSALGRPKITVQGGSSIHLYSSYVAIMDIDVVSGRDPSLPGFKLTNKGGDVIIWGHDIIFEGNRVLYAHTAALDVEPQIGQPASVNDFIRRNVLAFSYSGDIGFSQGLHTDGLDSPVIEENFIHQNGWNPKVALGTNPQFNHGVYNSWNNGATNSYFRWNIFSNNCSTGLQQRSGGVCHNNLFLNNGTAQDYVCDTDFAYVDFNVSTVSKDCPTKIGPTTNYFYQGGGFLFQSHRGYLGNNIVCHGSPTATFPAYIVSRHPADVVPDAGNDANLKIPANYTVEVASNITYDFAFDSLDYTGGERPNVFFHDNITMKCGRKLLNFRPSPMAPATKLLGSISLTNNIYDLDGQFYWQNTPAPLVQWTKNVSMTGDKIGTVQFVDPTRTIESYIAYAKLGTSYNDFVNLALQQRKGYYNTALVAYSPNAWFQQGFAVVKSPTTKPVVVTPPASQPATKPSVPVTQPATIPTTVPTTAPTTLPVTTQPATTAATSTFVALNFNKSSAGITAVPMVSEKLGPATAVGYTLDGTFVEYASVNFEPGVKTFSANVGCQNDNAGHMVQVHLDSPTGPTVASMKITGTGGWYVFTQQSTPVTLIPTGIHDVYLVFNAPGTKQGVANVKTFTFTK